MLEVTRAITTSIEMHRHHWSDISIYLLPLMKVNTPRQAMEACLGHPAFSFDEGQHPSIISVRARGAGCHWIQARLGIILEVSGTCQCTPTGRLQQG